MSIFKSKTFWAQVFALVALAVPSTSQFIADNLGVAGSAWAVINVVLRFLTKDKVKIV